MFLTKNKKNKVNPSFILELTKKCNQDCLYCYNVWKADDTYPREELDTDNYIALLDKIINEVRPKRLTLSGGEPLLREDIFEIIDFINKKGIDINIITNGTLLNKEKINNLLEKGVKLFELSLLGSTPEIHEGLTNYKNSWEKIIANIKEIKKQGGKIVAVVVLTKKNINDVKNIIEILIALDVNGIMVNRVNIGGRGIRYMDKLIPEANDLEKAFEIINSLSEEYEIPITAGTTIPPCIIDTSKYNNIKFGYCQVGKEYPYYAIDPLGNLRPCNHSRLILGNIFSQNLKEIFNNDLLSDYRKAHPEECEGCSKLFDCQGGCKASAEVCFGNCKKMDPFVKKNWKNVIQGI